MPGGMRLENLIEAREPAPKEASPGSTDRETGTLGGGRTTEFAEIIDELRAAKGENSGPREAGRDVAAGRSQVPQAGGEAKSFPPPDASSLEEDAGKPPDRPDVRAVDLALPGKSLPTEVPLTLAVWPTRIEEGAPEANTATHRADERSILRGGGEWPAQIEEGAVEASPARHSAGEFPVLETGEKRPAADGRDEQENPRGLGGATGLQRQAKAASAPLRGFDTEPNSGSEPRRTDLSLTRHGDTFASSKISIVRQETHFSPAIQTSPMRQIADSIVTYLARSAAEGDAAAEAGQPPSLSPASAPASAVTLARKILAVELQPAGLGRVRVELSLKGEVLSVHLEAAHKETAQMIRTGGEKLTNALRSSGYQLNHMAVQVQESNAPSRIIQGDSGQLTQSNQSGSDSPQTSLSGSELSGDGEMSQDQFEHSPSDQAREGTNIDEESHSRYLGGNVVL